MVNPDVSNPFTPEQMELIETLKSVVQVAEEAGDMILRADRTKRKYESKTSCADLVTETDRSVECYVFGRLRELFPNHKFIGEESVAADNYGKVTLTDDPTWIVDPIDGR